MHFLEIIKQQYSKTQQNTKQCMVFFFPNWSFFISEKCMVTPDFLFEYQEHFLSSAFSG